MRDETTELKKAHNLEAEKIALQLELDALKVDHAMTKDKLAAAEQEEKMYRETLSKQEDMLNRKALEHSADREGLTELNLQLQQNCDGLKLKLEDVQ